MSSYIDRYKKRLNRNGNDVGDTYENNTIAFIEATFSASPTFRVLEIDSLEFPDLKTMDARVVEVERMGSLREILFRPNQSLSIGTYATFDNDTWLVIDKYGTSTGVGAKVLAEKCNRTLKWKNQKGEIVEHYCIASSSDLGSKAKQSRNEIEWNKYDVRLPLGQLFVFVELNNDTKTVELGHRFIFGNNAYIVEGVDDTTAVSKDGFGIMQLTIKLTTKKDQDDFVNNIAFNDYKVDEVGTPPAPPTGDTGDGGLLW